MKPGSSILLSFVVFATSAVTAQTPNCNSLAPDQSDFCWIKKFLANSPLHDVFDSSFLKYNVGNDAYYPKGDYVPWSGYYMPLKEGGIATRWRTAHSSHPATSTLLTWEQVRNMSVEDIANLSPSEKMDIFMGHKDFGITKNELTRRGPERANVQGWEGFCNGIRLAGAIFPEPKHDILVKSKSGEEIYILFFPADLKALGGAVYYYTEYYASLGENNKRRPNAGYFDILLRYCLGNQQRPFFLDIESSEQKWNETIVGFKREVLAERLPLGTDNAPAGASKVVPVRTTIYLLGELSYEHVNELTQPLIEKKELVTPWVTNYLLFINPNHEILDGRFTKFDINTEFRFLDYPDYVWLGGGKGTDELVIGSRSDNNVLLPFFEVQNLFIMSIK